MKKRENLHTHTHTHSVNWPEKKNQNSGYSRNFKMNRRKNDEIEKTRQIQTLLVWVDDDGNKMTR